MLSFYRITVRKYSKSSGPPENKISSFSFVLVILDIIIGSVLLVGFLRLLEYIYNLF